MTLSELATRYEALARNARPRSLAAAAIATRATIEAALEPHRRTGAAADTLTVVQGPSGLEIDGVRYLPFIKGVPHGAELRGVATEAYNAAMRAELGGA